MLKPGCQLLFWINNPVVQCITFLNPQSGIFSYPESYSEFYSMCGIAGIIRQRSATTATSLLAEQIKKMTGCLAHRGPDGEDWWINPAQSVAFGHRRLAIIDTSANGRQPMNYMNRYHIIHNGEIYNYPELKEALQKRGYRFISQTDTEVIAAAYDLYKNQCVSYFDGMFAFAIWDEQEQQLFAARDRFGEKPFFFYFDDTCLVFASEIKALWAAGINREPNLKMLFNFLTIGYTGNPLEPSETFYNKISKLPAASRMSYSLPLGEMLIDKYWDIDLANVKKNISETEAAEQFRHLFSQSVKRRLRSDVEIGSSLSGGLDSSSVVAVSQPLLADPQNHQCFTASFPGFEKDELLYAKQVTSHFSRRHHVVSLSAEDLSNDLQNIMHYQEEPFGSASIVAQFKVYELAQRQGIKVLLDGQGADEILAGYPKYYKWYWQELFRKRQLLRSGELKAAWAKGVTEKFRFSNVLAALFPEFAAVFLEKQYLLHALRQKDLTAEFIKLQSKEAYYTTPVMADLNGVLYFNTFINGLEELLRYADRNAMAHSCEIRLPFLQHELVEFIFSLPSHLKIRNGWTKWILRKSMHDILPENITWRKDKVGFEPPQQQWMKHKSVQALIQAAKKRLVNEKILKPEILKKDIAPSDAYVKNNFDWKYLSAGLFLGI